MPFIRLALARYQPNSVFGKHLSTVVLADFAQLTPDQAAILTFDPEVLINTQTEDMDGQILWRGSITLPLESTPDAFRLLIREYEALHAQRRQPKVQRLAYADILPLSASGFWGPIPEE